jgi:hypothetical protein
MVKTVSPQEETRIAADPVRRRRVDQDLTALCKRWLGGGGLQGDGVTRGVVDRRETDRLEPGYPQGLALASPVPAIVALLLDMSRVDMSAEIVWWATFWDVVLIVLAVVVSAPAIWTLSRASRAYPVPELDAEDGEPVIETVLFGDRGRRARKEYDRGTWKDD